MPKCNRSEAQAIDYLYGELDASQVVDFERHLTTCDRCVRQVTAFKYVLHLVDEAEEELAPHAIAPHNLQMKLYKRLAAVPPDKPSLRSRLSDFSSNILLVLQEQKVASICLFTVAVITVAFFVGNPFRPGPPKDEPESAAARIEQYRHQGIQRSLDDVLRNKHLRNSDDWDTVSQLNRVKDRAQGTDLAIIANKHLKRVNSKL